MPDALGIAPDDVSIKARAVLQQVFLLDLVHGQVEVRERVPDLVGDGAGDPARDGKALTFLGELLLAFLFGDVGQGHDHAIQGDARP
jgi:hypothetical protein